MLEQVQQNRIVHDKPFVIQQNISLADKNYFRTGGLARYFAQPATAEQFAQAINFAHKENLEIFVLGSGANVLISDDGFDGLVIMPQLHEIVIHPSDTTTVLVQVGAGVTIERLIEFCLQHQIIGLEEFSGIPSTIGGAVYINLHYYEFSFEQFLVSAQLICKTTGTIISVNKDWFDFGYDHSSLQKKEYFVLDVILKLTRTDAITTAFAQGRSVEIIRHRRKRYPYKNTCGSFFRNFHPHEVACTDKKLIYVAYYLDQLGFKGHATVGGAIVSHQHANMIVNYNQATSADIVNLARMMQDKVYQAYSIVPQVECQLVGFTIDPFKL